MAAQITALPTAPSITDPANFETRADALVGALSTFVTEANALSTEVNTKSSDASTFATNASNSATTATTKAAEAAASAVTANNAAGAAKWLVGTTYSEGNTVYSPTDLQSYRRNSTGAPAAGGADPASNPTWWVMIGTVVPSFVYINIMGLI